MRQLSLDLDLSPLFETVQQPPEFHQQARRTPSHSERRSEKSAIGDVLSLARSAPRLCCLTDWHLARWLECTPAKVDRLAYQLGLGGTSHQCTFDSPGLAEWRPDRSKRNPGRLLLRRFFSFESALRLRQELEPKRFSRI